eukprot:801956-Alexandrium_andersonii.AAC.1
MGMAQRAPGFLRASCFASCSAPLAASAGSAGKARMGAGGARLGRPLALALALTAILAWAGATWRRPRLWLGGMAA